MLSPRWRKVLRDVWGNKLRTILVVLSIAVGVFAIGSIATSQGILDTDMTNAYLSVNPSNASLGTWGFDDALLHTVRRMDGVTDAQGRANVGVRVQVGPAQWKSLSLAVLDDFDDLRINIVRPVSGEWPPSRKTMLIERGSLAYLGLHVGDEVLVELPDGKQRTVRISGAAHDINQFPSFFSGTGYGYITFDTLEWLGWDRYFDQLDIIVTGDTMDVERVRAVADEVRAKVESGGRVVSSTYVPVPGKHPADQYIRPMVYLLGVLGMLSLLSGALLVFNTISAVITQQIRQIGVMKAIGARSGQVTGIYLSMVLVFGLLAVVVAAPLGAVGAMWFCSLIASLVNFDVVSFRLPPGVLALELVVALVVPLLAALYPVINGTRITVREAISSYGLGQGRFGSDWLDRLTERVRFLSRPMLLSLRNTFRRKGRLVITLATLVLGGAIFVGVFSVQASLMRTLDEALEYWQYDVEVSFGRAYRAEQIEREALRLPGVVAAESWAFYATRRARPDGTDSKEIYIVSPPAQTRMLKPRLLEGRWLDPADENAIVINTEILKNEPDVKVGDDITLRIKEQDTTWRVVGIVKGVLTGPLAYANYPYFSRAIGNAGRAGRVQVITDRHDAAYTAEISRQLEDHFESAGLRVGSRQTTHELRQQAVTQFNLIVVFLLIMAVLLALVGGLGLMGTMSLNVIERTREIGVLRAVGASDWAILKIVVAEGLIIGGLSWGLAVVVALPLSMALSQTVGSLMLQAPLSYAYSMQGAALWLAVVVAVATLASLLPARNASRLSVREILAYE